MYFIKAYRVDCYQKNPVLEIAVKDKERMEREVGKALSEPGVKVIVMTATNQWIGAFSGHKKRTGNGNLLRCFLFSQEHGKERNWRYST